MTKEERFKERAATGNVCLNVDCPQREHCLRWQLREYVPRDRVFVMSVNPRYKGVAQGQCPAFRSDERITLAKGMVHFYDEMPRRMEERVKGLLIARYGRTIYYEYRNGKRLISPAMQAYIKDTCLHCGWTKEPVYDGYEEDYDWE